jgi:hypothetical protein
MNKKIIHELILERFDENPQGFEGRSKVEVENILASNRKL